MFRPVSRVVLLAALATSCGEPVASSDVGVRMSFVRSANDYFSAPFPSQDVLSADGTVDLDDHPGPRDLFILGAAIRLANHRQRGFGTSAPIVFTFTGEFGRDFPSVDESIAPDATVQLFDVSTTPPTPKRIRVGYLANGGPYGAPNMLSVLPVQGLPLEPGHLHAVVVKRSLGDAEGVRLARSGTLADLAAGRSIPGLSDAARADYVDALDALRDVGLSERDLAGMAVFETQDPVAELREYYADARSRPVPTPVSPLAVTDTHPDYCIFESTIRMPSYQQGVTPFSTSGGSWARDSNGEPSVVEDVETRIFVTVPRRAMPASGFPAVVYIRAGGGGRVPLADRAPHPSAGDPGVAGTGPAMIFAQAGFAGITIDGPAGGLRNPNNSDEQFLVFNTANPPALIDNLRQYALESALTAHVLEQLTIPVATSGCADVTVGGSETDIRFDTTKLALFGHSMGASIAPLAAAIEPRFRGVLLSGAGASWIENVIYKEEPLAIRPVLAFQLDNPDLDVFDPGVGMLQWVGEVADAQVYARHLVHAPLDATAPRHVLMFQGIVDHYIMPPIANALSLAGGFDLAGAGLEQTVPELDGLEPLATLLPWTGRAVVPYPVAGNVGAGVAATTAVVAQHLEDGVEDGHEVFYQLEGPRFQARCFLAALAAGGVPAVPAPAPLATTCP